jgi:hypothetical protein
MPLQRLYLGTLRGSHSFCVKVGYLGIGDDLAHRKVIVVIL